jgi:hypothetical protein
VVVRVVPVDAGRVVLRQLVLVLERLPGRDLDEGVVAVVARRDVQAVGVQVGDLVEVVALTRRIRSRSPARTPSVGPGAPPL